MKSTVNKLLFSDGHEISLKEGLNYVYHRSHIKEKIKGLKNMGVAAIFYQFNEGVGLLIEPGIFENDKNDSLCKEVRTNDMFRLIGQDVSFVHGNSCSSLESQDLWKLSKQEGLSVIDDVIVENNETEGLSKESHFETCKRSQELENSVIESMQSSTIQCGQVEVTPSPEQNFFPKKKRDRAPISSKIILSSGKKSRTRKVRSTTNTLDTRHASVSVITTSNLSPVKVLKTPKKPITPQIEPSIGVKRKSRLNGTILENETELMETAINNIPQTINSDSVPVKKAKLDEKEPITPQKIEEFTPNKENNFDSNLLRTPEVTNKAIDERDTKQNSFEYMSSLSVLKTGEPKYGSSGIPSKVISKERVTDSLNAKFKPFRICVTGIHKKDLLRIKRKHRTSDTIKIVEDIANAQVLVLNGNKIERTFKLLYAASLGFERLKIVSTQFLNLKNLKSFDYRSYNIVDKEYEKKYPQYLNIKNETVEVNLHREQRKRTQCMEFMKSKSFILTKHILPKVKESIELLHNLGCLNIQVLKNNAQKGHICLTCEADLQSPTTKRRLHKLKQNDCFVLDVCWLTHNLVEFNFEQSIPKYSVFKDVV